MSAYGVDRFSFTKNDSNGTTVQFQLMNFNQFVEFQDRIWWSYTKICAVKKYAKQAQQEEAQGPHRETGEPRYAFDLLKYWNNHMVTSDFYNISPSSWM